MPIKRFVGDELLEGGKILGGLDLAGLGTPSTK